LRDDQAPEDRVLILVILGTFAVWLAFMALDAARFRWSSVPLWAQVLGALGVLASSAIGVAAMHANSFAAAVVRVQRERGHRVVTSGPYAFVRHPIYAGAILLCIGTPLLLGSWWGLAFLPVQLVLFGRRAVVEERLLSAELLGYEDYAARVRYRLVPRIW